MTDQSVTVEEGNGLLIKYDGGNRFITEDEIRQMCEGDHPVTVT